MFNRFKMRFLVPIGLTTIVQLVNGGIAGKVSNKAGSPIANATLELVIDGTKASTGADGTYSMAVGVSVLHAIKPQTEGITLNKGVLELNLTKSTPVKVEIFDVKGNLLKKETVPNASAGTYRLQVASVFSTAKLLVINASIGQRTMTFRYVPLQNGASVVNAPVGSSDTHSGRLAKITAIVDTLQVTATNYTEKKIAITSYDTTVNVTLDTADDNSLAVRLDQEKQTIQGFGINATIMEGSLPWSQLFSTDLTAKDALGLSILRIGMDSKGNHRQVPSDWTSVRTVNPQVKVIGSCWSAPKEWKSNGSEDRGGYLKEENYSQWAERIATYAKTNNLYAMSVANESDFASCASKGPPCTVDYPSMVYTAKQMVKFVKAARTAFTAKAPGVKIIAPEASLWEHVWSTLSSTQKAAGYYDNADPLGCGCFSNDINDSAALKKCNQKCFEGDGYDYGHWLAKDTEAWNSFDILGVHQYESQVAYPWPADVTNGKRDKEVWETEMSGVKHWPEEGPTTHIQNGVAVARWIQSGLTIGEASAWCWWWYKDYYNDDNEGLALLKSGNTIAKRYYTFGNYSRYIRPGHKIVNITGTDQLPAKVLLTASKDSTGTVVVVAVNETTSAQSVPIKISGGTAPASFKPYVTADGAGNNWKEGSAVTVTDGVLTMQLEKMSVTTFVGK